MSYNNYNNNYSNYSNYGFGGNNYSNITSYTTPQQDKVSQVVNLLNQCSIEQLEKINGKLAEIKQQKEKQFWNDIYMWCCNSQQILGQINDMELSVALQCNRDSFNKQQFSHLVKYMHLKHSIEEVLQNIKSTNIRYITDRKDVNVFKQQALQIVQNAKQAIRDIKAQNSKNYNQNWYNENMRAQIQKFMNNDFQNWFTNMVKNGLWVPNDGKGPNYIMYTDPQKDAARQALCAKAAQIHGYIYDIDGLQKFLNCQLSDVIENVRQFMQKCNIFIRKYGKQHQDITNYTNYGLAKSYNNNMIGYSGYNN